MDEQTCSLKYLCTCAHFSHLLKVCLIGTLSRLLGHFHSLRELKEEIFKTISLHSVSDHIRNSPLVMQMTKGKNRRDSDHDSDCIENFEACAKTTVKIFVYFIFESHVIQKFKMNFIEFQKTQKLRIEGEGEYYRTTVPAPLAVALDQQPPP